MIKNWELNTISERKKVDKYLLAISAITWLGSFAERLYFSIGDIIDFILEIDDLVIELAIDFARGFGQLLSELLSEFESVPNPDMYLNQISRTQLSLIPNSQEQLLRKSKTFSWKWSFEDHKQ